MPSQSALHVLDIQRFSTEDGPGLRTTVFTNGSALHWLPPMCPGLPAKMLRAG